MKNGRKQKKIVAKASPLPANLMIVEDVLGALLLFIGLFLILMI